MVKASFCFGLFALLHSSTVQAQDLDRETPLEPELSLRHVTGLGAHLESCKLTEKNNLRCRADRPLKTVECFSGNSGDSKKSEVQKTGLKSDFLCDKPFVENPDPSYSSLWDIFIYAEDGTMSEWVVEGVSVSQMNRGYQAELTAFKTIRHTIFDSYNIGVEESTRPSSQYPVYAGFTTLATLRGAVDGFFSVLVPLSGISLGNASNHSDIDIGMQLRIIDREAFSVGATFGSGWITRSFGDARVFDNSIGLWTRPELWSSRSHALMEIKFVWPQVDSFKQDVEAGVGLEFGPWLRHWNLKIEALYYTESWTNLGLAHNEEGLESRLTVAWLSDHF